MAATRVTFRINSMGFNNIMLPQKDVNGNPLLDENKEPLPPKKARMWQMQCQQISGGKDADQDNALQQSGQYGNFIAYCLNEAQAEAMLATDIIDIDITPRPPA